MELNDLFSLFIDDEDKNYLSPPEDDFISSINYKINMFIKILKNGHIFKDSIVSFLSKSDEELDYDNVRQAGEFLIQNRAWFWVCLFTPNDNWKLSLQQYPDKLELIKYVNLSIKYFESYEEYEKCATLVEILNIVKNSLD